MCKNTALVLASLLFSLFLVELALRLLGWSFPVFAQPDPDLGWSFWPGLQGWSMHENTAYLRVNRMGFRGDDWAPQARGFCIAVLGDSFVDSTNLPEEEALTALIQRNLRDCPAFAAGVETRGNQPSVRSTSLFTNPRMRNRRRALNEAPSMGLIVWPRPMAVRLQWYRENAKDCARPRGAVTTAIFGCRMLQCRWSGYVQVFGRREH